ncbi:MAG: hypothetical protein Q7O66_21000 [Dehalococcoidia bacterium]|nr:hypothetical protein [Dehalococcoidia bacterium]
MRLAILGRGRTQEPEWAVLLTVAVALALGWLVQMSVAGRTFTTSAAGMTITYPVGWMEVSEEGAAFAAVNLGAGIFGPRVGIRQIAKDELVVAGGSANLSLADISTAWSVRRAVELSAYRVLKLEAIQLHGREAVSIRYAFLAEGRAGAASNTLPVVMQGTDTIMAGGDQFHILTFACQSDKFDGLAGLRQSLLNSWRVP